jgi:hypothetical protein
MSEFPENAGPVLTGIARVRLPGVSVSMKVRQG